MAKSRSAYNRVLVKISGEGLAGDEGFGISGKSLAYVAGEIGEAVRLGIEVAVVVGGGNILRGGAFSQKASFPEATAHQMGMLATVINALALQETLEREGVAARTLSSISVGGVCEPFVRRRAVRHLEKKRVVIVAGGTGRPFVTTDTAAALAAAEIGAEAVLKGTQVDGVYSADPKKDASAVFYPELTYDRVIDERLAVMDLSAVDMCQRNGIGIVVFNLHTAGNLKRIVAGDRVGTVVSAG